MLWQVGPHIFKKTATALGTYPSDLRNSAPGEGLCETLLRLVMESEPAAPRRRNASIPKDLQTIVLRATTKDPTHRYHTAQDLADDLRRFLTDADRSQSRYFSRINGGCFHLPSTASAFGQ